MSLIFFLLLLFSSQEVCAKTTWSETVYPMIKKTLAEVEVDSSHFGLWVKHKDEIIHHNSEKLFTPASLTKIPTALAFLDHRSLDEVFYTRVYKTGKINAEGILEGDLYLKGEGDPSLVSENLWLLVKDLKRTGIRQVKGKVYVDESYFDADYYSRGRQKRRVDRAYDAPVSALSFNWNSLSIFVRPGDKLGQAARVFVEPNLKHIEVVNQARTVRGDKQKLQVERSLKDEKILVKVTGEIGLNSKEKDFYKSIDDAAIWTGKNFVHMMREMGIEVPLGVQKKVVPQGAEELVEYKGWDLARVMSALSKYSNNFVAEVLTKHLGKKPGEPARIEDGLKQIRSYLHKKGWKEEEFRIENPSGFTHSNKMRADRLGELLSDAQNRFDLGPEFLASLPISGVDGTLEKRLQQVMKSKVRAKTGYLGGVVTLAGYLQSQKGDSPLVFVFFYNGPHQNDWEVRALFDKILWRLYQSS